MKYDFYPAVKVKDEHQVFFRYDVIVQQIIQEVKAKSLNVITIENYPVVDERELLEKLIQPLSPDLVIHSDAVFVDDASFEQMITRNLTSDRVFGVMSNHCMEEFVDSAKLAAVQRQIAGARPGLVLIYGVGASLVTAPDLLIYADLSRWEIQTRYRSGKFPNWKAHNAGEDWLQMAKRGYFFEWQVADRQKKKALPKADYVLDTHKAEPVMLTASSYFKALEEVSRQPFSLVPFFDPGVWGGHWMQETFDFRKEEVNLAWCFNGVPEENSLLLDFGAAAFETPANNLMFFNGEEVLGPRVFGRFGAEFPIRFNFLDTVGGQNLSLQVHPKLTYIQDTFGVPYTQDESYYVLHAEEGAKIYLGFKNGIEKEAVMSALKRAEAGEEPFDDQQFIYQQPISKHDHYLIPAGTIHSSGANSVVLEISSTPNRFTFKLWDWGRVDLDGKPRSVHLNHGEPNLDMRRDEEFVRRELINQFVVVAEGEGWQEERTGLHELEWIETRRHTFSQPVDHLNHQGVNVLNLVEGEEVTIESLDESFAPFVVHYAQTVILPATIQRYRVTPTGKSAGKTCRTIKAFIR